MTDMIVPVQVHALVVNEPVLAQGEDFERWRLDFHGMLTEKLPAEPAPGATEEVLEGVYVSWQLPESLAMGHLDTETDETVFPLVPNRWLVVRQFTVPSGFPDAGARQGAAWLVHSDYLELAHGGTDWGTGQFLARDPVTGKLEVDYLGRVHDLRLDPWTEPAPVEPFLTAVGPGVLAFAGFQPYNENVFSFHDDLSDLVGYGHNKPAPSMLSYLVVGWYSDDASDILARAGTVPGLLPPDVPDHVPPEAHDTWQVLTGLGWDLPGLTDPDPDAESEPEPDPGAPQIPTRSVYSGTALAVGWEYYATEAPLSNRPDHLTPKIAVGHSTADALEALAASQTGSSRTGRLLGALYAGAIDAMDDGDGEIDLEEVLRHAWFASCGGGYQWQVTPRDTDDSEPLHTMPTRPAWLDVLNADQAEFDALTIELDNIRARLATLWWLKDLPQRPDDFAEAADDQLDPDIDGTLAQACANAAARMRSLIADRRLPVGVTPEQLEPLIAEYADRNGLPPTLQLTRVSRENYCSPADPALIIVGAGEQAPLGRGPGDPLPCRTSSMLVTELAGQDAIKRPPLALARSTGTRNSREQARVPVVLTGQTTALEFGFGTTVEGLLDEFVLLDHAAITPADDGSGATLLELALAQPDLVHGVFGEYTGMWQQPWLPMYVQWDLRYHPVPYQTDDRVHWQFDGLDYKWLGTGAEPGDGFDGTNWLSHRSRSFLTPSVPYVAAAQLDRLLATYRTDEPGLRALREDYSELDLLSQTLEGFNDRLLMRDIGIRSQVPDATAALTGDAGYVADPGSPGDGSESRFQPLRAGQLYFRDLRIIDRFGRSLIITHVAQDAFKRLRPIRARSVTPTHDLAEGIESARRFLQLPPRLLQPARVRLELTRADDTLLSAGQARAGGIDSPLTGWLLINHLDDTLLVYDPDGDPVGELRIVRADGGNTEVAFTPLPGSPLRDEDDPTFEARYPHLAGLVRPLVGPPGAYRALLATIETTLETIIDPAAEDDRTPARLVGRPIALYRARLNLELRGDPITSPGWDQALEPAPAPFPKYEWPVKIGDPDRLADGLIGYYASSDGPGTDTDYSRLHVHKRVRIIDDPYLAPIDIGAELMLPVRPPEDEVVHHLTILADPHVPVHASTGILPVTRIQLPGDLAATAMRRIRAAFRLSPLLAPVRVPSEPGESRNGHGGEHLVVVRPAAHHGVWSWAEPVTEPDSDELRWRELPLYSADGALHPDDPTPRARSGYLLLHPVDDSH